MGEVRNKYCIKSAGMILTLVNIALMIVDIFLCGYQFRQTHQNFTSHGEYRVLGILQLCLVLFLFVSIFIAFVLFSCLSENKPFSLFFIIVNGLSMLFTLSVSIFSLIAGAIGNVDDYVGCQRKFKGMFKYWNSIDNIMIDIDKTLCSNDCLCYISPYTKSLYHTDSVYRSIFDDTVKGDENETIVNIKQCSKSIKNQMENEIEKKAYENEIKDFNLNKFATYWKYIEEKFECNGFCSTIYEDNDKQRVMIKYLFRDVNIGYPKQRGCMIPFMKWIKKMLLSFGVLTLLSGLIQIAMFGCGVSLFLVDVTGKINDKEPIMNDKKVEMTSTQKIV